MENHYFQMFTLLQGKFSEFSRETQHPPDFPELEKNTRQIYQ
jgi:hypothetical protein